MQSNRKIQWKEEKGWQLQHPYTRTKRNSWITHALEGKSCKFLSSQLQQLQLHYTLETWISSLNLCEVGSIPKY